MLGYCNTVCFLTSGSPYLWFINNYLYFILNISLVFDHRIGSLHLENSRYSFTKLTCLYRNVVDTYVQILWTNWSQLIFSIYSASF
jgi:hypothetical protein